MELNQFKSELQEILLETNVPENLHIDHIAYDSSKVENNTLFICKGAGFQEKYLEDAKRRGALCYVADRKFSVDLPFLLVSDLRLALGKIVRLFYGNVSEMLPLIGITGTKGKTTTALFLRSILDQYLSDINKNMSGLLCSILTYDGVEELPSRLTTKEPIELYEHFSNAISTKTPYLVMEVSSQAVKYHRIYGLEFDIGCYLNIGEDHISPKEHPDFEDYFSSKLAFFDRCSKMCVNLDGVFTPRVLAHVREGCKLITCSSLDASADFFVTQRVKRGISSEFIVKTPIDTQTFTISMPGLFNIDNALAAIAISYELGIPVKYIQDGLLLGRSPGRMELYETKDEKITIMVDYAHNKMSFQALFASIAQEFPHKKVVAVFGCPGDKALDRRESLGKIANKYADFILLTEDDPGHEGVLPICQDIAQYMDPEKITIQPDRTLAVKQACELYPNQEKVVLLLGKGEESDQKRGDSYEQSPSDSVLAQDYIRWYQGE